ncbi:SigE family RNA polymerase sigma factor [Actinocorallia aurantiaca]|uniref:SigE family RNA polymerase sigma factor n=1 Tax=Actinocorallia aurantiaca TaxID=46204 RepID=A0ABP6HB63_9ACTN
MADEESFAEFYRGAYPGLVIELYAYTGDLGDAQDAAQEAFARTWQRWDKVGSYDRPRAWVARVGYRLAVSRWRKARSTLANLWRQGPQPDVAPPGVVSMVLVEALRLIPERQRRAVVLHYMGGYSVAEIAEMDGVAEGTVKAWLSRGRRRLAELLTDETNGMKEANRYA